MHTDLAVVDGVADPRLSVQGRSRGSPACECLVTVSVHMKFTSLHSVFVNSEYFSGSFFLHALHTLMSKT
jgi:hypothetical protein